MNEMLLTLSHDQPAVSCAVGPDETGCSPTTPAAADGFPPVGRAGASWADTRGTALYVVPPTVKCSGTWCRDCCFCGRYSTLEGENYAALWARIDLDSARCNHFLEMS